MMQPPPRTGPPPPPPPLGGIPNAFRRTWPHKQTGSSSAMLGPAQPVPPMTDPFAFGRQGTSGAPAGNHQPTFNSSHLPMQAPLPAASVSADPSPGQEAHPQEVAKGPPLAPFGLGANSLLPENVAASFVPPRQFSGPSNLAGSNAPGTEEGYLNTKEHGFYVPAGGLPQTQTALYQAQVMQPAVSPWISDHGSRPPSVQNYFQPTSDSSQLSSSFSSVCPPDPPLQAPPLQAPPPAPSPHKTQAAPSPYSQAQKQMYSAQPGLGGPQSSPTGPFLTENCKPEGNSAVTQQQNSQFQAHNYFGQNSTVPNPWFNQASREPFYHQMGGSSSDNRPSSSNDQQAPLSSPSGSMWCAADPGTISLFFKENDVENEETLTGEGKAVNGFSGGDAIGVGYGMNTLPPNPLMSLVPLQAGSEVSQRGDINMSADGNAQFAGESAALYVNDGRFVSGTQKQEGQFDHVENLECMPNQEVLPNEPQKMAQNISEHPVSGQANTAIHSGVHYEGGPNLETPDLAPRPVRPESVSSSYSNVSHGSASGTRRLQGMVGTFIQQEVAKPSEDSSAGYFEQIDTSPAGEGTQQHVSTKMSHGQLSQPVTPSPPKPTGIFQASANSSFEPVHAHSVGVRPLGIDQARMVAEKGGSGLLRMSVPNASPGNLEQPPDNLENIFMTSIQHPGAGVPEKRPCSRAHGSRLVCESPATTLWAQNELAIANANVVLAPAAPPAHELVKQPSAEVIQPPEDGPLDLQAVHHTPHLSQRPDNTSENLENPPKLSEPDPKVPQASLGYASLLVTSPATESFQNQPVLIAPPSTNCSLIPPNNCPAMVSNELPQNSGVDVRTKLLQQPSEVCAKTVPAGPPKSSNPLEHFASPVCPGNSGGRPAPNQSPLNLALESRQILKRDNPPAVSTGRPPDYCLPHADQLAGPSHPAPPVNSPALPVAENHKQPANFEFLDCTMSFSQSTAPNVCSVPSVVSQQALPAAPVLKPAVPLNNLAGFYRQVTKDTQQGGSGQNEPQSQRLADPGVPPGAAATNIQQAAPDSTHWSESRPHLNAGDAPANQTTQTPLQGNQYPQPPVPGQAPPGAFLPGAGGSEQTPYPPQPGNSSRPPSVLAGPPGYGGIPPVPAPMYGPYYGGAYPEYIDGRLPYPPPYPSCDPKAQPYYQDDPYRRYDPRYSRYEGSNVGYRDAERYQQREQPERPSSRTSQYSDRPSSRQGYPEDYQRASRSAYDEYYASYYKQAYDYGDRRWEHYDPLSTYDPRYRGYYDQSYWYNYDHKAYRSREMYYNQPYPNRREAYDDQWRYDPRYDASFDEQYACQRDLYRDDIDRHSVHSERSGHSLRSSRSHHSRRSSFSSRSQQSQVYRSQQDLVSAAYEPPGQAASIPVDYTYGQYPDNTDGGYQYPSAYPSEGGWSAVEQPAPRPVTPEKFVVPHCCARFGPSGQLIQVLPNLPSAGQPALVEIHSMEMMLQESEEQKELRSFPGPLVKDETHKVDVIKFAQDKSLACQRDDSLMDKDSAKLIWDFIVLLCRQNGTVVGTDIADLLLREHRSVWLPGKSPNEANLIDFTNEPLERPEDEPGLGPLSLLSDTFMTVPENPGKETERFRELLLFGRKKDALESAMKNGLWGHALLLASKMDNRTHARVMTRFANSLPINDPLQTVYQLMSGRMPAAATCCGDEKWGDWRPHLAMVLSNLTHALDLDMRTIATMGDTLASKGLIDAAHFCYMMAQVGLGVYTKKSTKMVLIGSNHSLPFFRFASNVAIQRTEAYEYALSLGSQPCSLPNFQVYKFLYACRLAEAGLCAQAFHYCEVISKAVLTMASYHSAMFISQLIQMSAKLRFFDPQLKEKPEQELFVEPDWLFQLRQLDGQIRDGVISYSTDRATPQQYVCSTPSSEFDQPTPPDHTGMSMDMTTNPDNTLMMSLLPSPGQPLPGVQLMPPAPPTILDEGMISVPPVPPAIESVQFYPAPPSHLYPTPGTIPPQQGPIHGAVLSMPSYTQAYPVSQPSSQISATVASPAPLEQQVPPQISSQPASPSRSTFTPHMDFYDQMANMASGKRSRTTSQSSLHTGQGLRSRTTSESSTHSMGRERSNSAAKPSLSNPEPIPEQPPHQDESKKSKKESPKKGSGSGWLGWFSRKGKTEAHLPDDKNKSIVWDSQKNRWVNTDEPEEENKPPPPPPSTFPKMAPQAGPGSQSGPPSGGPQVNIFSRKAGTRSRYVDVLNPGGASNKPAGSVPVPADLFAPLAPMPMPPNVFIPGAAPEEQQPLEGTIPEMTKEAVYPPSQDGAPVVDSTQAGELSRSSSMSSLSREVSQHLNQVPTQTPSQAGQPAGTVTFYNPSQFAQPSAPLGAAKQGRFGQRKYPALK